MKCTTDIQHHTPCAALSANRCSLKPPAPAPRSRCRSHSDCRPQRLRLRRPIAHSASSREHPPACRICSPLPASTRRAWRPAERPPRRSTTRQRPGGVLGHAGPAVQSGASAALVPAALGRAPGSRDVTRIPGCVLTVWRSTSSGPSKVTLESSVPAHVRPSRRSRAPRERPDRVRPMPTSCAPAGRARRPCAYDSRHRYPPVRSHCAAIHPAGPADSVRLGGLIALWTGDSLGRRTADAGGAVVSGLHTYASKRRHFLVSSGSILNAQRGPATIPGASVNVRVSVPAIRRNRGSSVVHLYYCRTLRSSRSVRQ